MVNQESLNKLYELIISCHELTTKELNNCGFNSKDLSDLIENETLTRIRRGYYTFLKIDDLYNYGKKLASLKKYDAATACFEKCYQLDPNNTQVCFQLFFRCVINSNYNKIFEYFDKFYDDCEFCNYDNNFYLYLLSMITELPEKHREYAKFLRFEDVRVDFKDNDAKTQNRIRALALNQKFSLALKQLNDLGSQYGKLNIQNIIIKSLLKKTIEKQTLVRENLINLINERKYEGVIEYLESIQEYHRLGEVNEIVLTLTEDLIGIAKKGIIPEKQIFTTDKLFEAITGKNYELALLLCEEYNDKNNIKSNSNVIYMLLEEINNLINKKEKIELPIKEKNEKVKDMKESIEEISTDNLVSNDDIYVNIVNYLMKNDLDNAFITLKSYLKNFNKSEFEFLIINLIKISLMEKDIAFTKPMIVLTYISRDNFQFNVLEYIQDFYEAISKNEYDKARIYLDIIAKSSVLEDTNELAIRLEQLLNGLEKNKSQNEVVEIKEEKNSQNEEKQLEETKIIKNTSTVMIKKDENQEFINSKLNELFENGIVVLKPMNKERRIKIHNIVNSIRDVESFSIGVESNRQIVLRFKPYLEEYINISKLANEGRKAYKLGDYDLCINKYRQLLEFGKPKAWVYAQIGLSYMKKNNIKLAINYLTVATELSKVENSDYDFTKLLESLKEKKDKNPTIKFDIYNDKPIVKMDIDEFKTDIINDNYGIDNIDEIANLISTGMSLNDVCIKLELSEEQKSILLLIYAREYYIQANYKAGDRYLKEAEKIKCDSRYVKSLINEVRKNKNFYKHKVDEEYKSLILKMR